MKHAILGAGAIGGLIATVLSSLGEEVTVIVRPESIATFPKLLSLERPTGPVTASATLVASLTEAVDVLWIATKTYQLENALETVKTTPRYVVPLLNGVDHVASLRSRFGNDHVLPATVAVEAERVAAGRFVQVSPFVRLNIAASGEPLLGAIAGQLANLGFTCRFIENEQTLLWTKLCFLGSFALVTSASGMNVGEILADAAWKEKLWSAIGEACAVATASGAEVELQQFLTMFTSVPPVMRSSMQKDVAAGRRLELDAIAGPIIRGGDRYNVDVSTVVGLVSTIRAKAS
jgi:2-dehydropantoate 2-reductase